ncbi:MAG: MAPEG family protein [Pseudomonadota bacterium]
MTPALATFALFAGLNALIFLALTANVIRYRGKHDLALGDGGHEEVTMAIRGQGNAAEQMPMGLILLGIMAGMGTPAWVIGLVGAIFTLGRALHAVHFTFRAGGLATRAGGMLLTLLALGLMALGVLAHGLTGLA